MSTNFQLPGAVLRVITCFRFEDEWTDTMYKYNDHPLSRGLVGQQKKKDFEPTYISILFIKMADCMEHYCPNIFCMVLIT